MEAQQLYMDTIAHNLSNVNTNSYKRQKIEFHDLMYQVLKEPGVRNEEGTMAPAGIEVGLGVKTSATQRIFEQGSLNQTGNQLDLSIQGNGFFQVSLPDSQMMYTRDGQLKLSSDGTIVTTDGYPIYPQISVPEGAQEISISAEGQVAVKLQGETTSSDIGQLEIARFINPAGLEAQGDNLYALSDASGEPIINNPGEEGAGTIRQGYVEASNVQIVDEMVNMISAQRAYEIISKSIQVSEEMMTTVSNLKR
jgi:flagellar basal-body rod protein FlgG